MKLCDFDGAMLTFQKGCKANPSDKELREHWFMAKEVCRTFRSAGRIKGGGEGAKILAFEAARQPVLHEVSQLAEAADRSQARRGRRAEMGDFFSCR